MASQQTQHPTSDAAIPSSTAVLRIGIDVGGVLSVSDPAEGGEQGQVFTQEGSLHAIQTLQKLGHTCVINSFCGKRRSIALKKALSQEYKEWKTEDMYFVKDRAHKAVVCQHRGLHVMIDDNPAVLLHIAKVCNDEVLLILFGATRHDNKQLYPVQTWPEVVELLARLKRPDHIPKPVAKLTKFCYL